MNKNNLITIVLILALEIFGLSFVLMNNNEKTNCDGRKNKDACFHNLAVAEKNSIHCENIIKQISADNCYGAVASHTGEVTLLEKINDVKSKEDWTQEVAYKNRDPLLCEQISTSVKRNSCLHSLSRFQGGIPEICEKILEDKYNVKGQCYFDIAMKEMNTKYCEIANYKKSLCYSNIAVMKKDMNICNSIKDLGEIDNCLNFYKRDIK